MPRDPIQLGKLIGDIATGHMVALYTTWYSFARQQKTLRVAPAMAAGISDRLWDMADVVALIAAAAEPRKARGT